MKVDFKTAKFIRNVSAVFFVIIFVCWCMIIATNKIAPVNHYWIWFGVLMPLWIISLAVSGSMQAEVTTFILEAENEDSGE